MDRKKGIRIGTRGSLLALEQTDQVIAALTAKYPQLQIEKVILHTQGDKILDKPLFEFGGKGMFITEFEEALADGKIDLAIHSAKDMPMELAEGLHIAGALPRADVRDVLVTRKGLSENRSFGSSGNVWSLGGVSRGIPSGDTVIHAPADSASNSMIIGTGSLRRQFQLKAIYPDVQCISIRGNVPTRLQKVRDGKCDGVILAAAGLERLGLLEEPDFDYRYFSQEEMVPAGGQGIIAIETRMDDEITGLVSGISNQNAMLELETERRVLELLEAGCHEAIGVISQVQDEQIAIQIIQELNSKVYRQQGKTTIENRLELAEQLVGSLQKD